MKFFLDQDVYAVTVHFLKNLDYDVLQAAQIGLSRAKDEELLKKAQEQNRIFVTRDRDFGRIIFSRFKFFSEKLEPRNELFGFRCDLSSHVAFNSKRCP